MNHTVRAVLEASAKYQSAEGKQGQAGAIDEFEKALRVWLLEELRTHPKEVSDAASRGNAMGTALGSN